MRNICDLRQNTIETFVAKRMVEPWIPLPQDSHREVDPQMVFWDQIHFLIFPNCFQKNVCVQTGVHQQPGFDRRQPV
jgi:hypothetical protein